MLCAGTAGHAAAQTTTRWIGPSSGAFGNPANWDNGVPGPLDTAIFEPPSSGSVRLFSSHQVAQVFVLGQYSFSLQGNSLEANQSINVAPPAPTATAIAEFFGGEVKARRVAANQEFGQADLRFLQSSTLVFTGNLGLPFPESASILAGVEPLTDPNASRRIRFEGPIVDARSMYVRPLGTVEFVGSISGNPQPAIFSGPVIIEPRGEVVSGRPIVADFIENYGTFIVDPLEDNVNVPTDVVFFAPYNQDAENGIGPEIARRSGVIQLDVFSPTLSLSDTLQVQNVARLSGGLQFTAPDPFVVEQGVGPVPLVFFEAISPLAPSFDIYTVPFTGEDGYFRPDVQNNTVTLETDGFPTPVEFSTPDPIDVGGFAADATTADFNGDGIPDLASALPVDSGPNGAITVVFTELGPNNAFFGFSAPSVFNSCENEPDLIESFDADADGDIDLAYYNRADNMLVVRLNDGAGGFDDLSFAMIELPPGVVDLVAGQFEDRIAKNGMDPEDLAVVIDNGPGVPGTVRFLISNGSDFEFCDVDTGPGPSSGDPIDIDGDQAGAYKDGVAVTVDGTDSVEIIPNPTDGGLNAEPNIVIPIDPGPSDVAAGDLDDDGFPDLTVSSESSGTVTILKSVEAPMGGSDRTFTSAVSLPASDAIDPAPQSLVLGDADEDGDADVFFTSNKAAASRGLPQREIRFFRNVRDKQNAIVFQESQALPRQTFREEIPNILVFDDFDLDRGTQQPGDDLVVLTLGGSDDGVTRLSQDEVTPRPCLADVNMDGELNGLDFGAWLGAFNAGAPAADQNQDGTINGLDFGAWLSNYNAGCP